MSNLVAVQDREFTKDQLELIKSTVARGATNDEMKLFLYRCQHMGLDPLKPGMVHFIKYGNNPGTIVIGIDGFRLKASKTGKHVGTKRGVTREDGKIVSAWAEVYRADWDHPAREEVPFVEYNTGKGNWAKMPETMIKKVAEVAALRMAFPDELGGLYSAEEMDQAHQPRNVAVVPHSDKAPDFEDLELEPIEVKSKEPDDEDPGSFVIGAGKNKGKRLRDLSRREIENFLGWYDEQIAAEKQMHSSVVEYADAARAYLEDV